MAVRLQCAGRLAAAVALAGACVAPWPARAALSVVDDDAQRIELPAPARRIASLAPSLTEIAFAIGAGPQVVTALASDHPDEAKALPSAGDFRTLDLEGIRARGVDLVLAWRSGNPPAQLQRLRELGIPVYVSEAQDFESVATTIERVGVLTGHADAARSLAAGFRTRMRSLESTYARRAPVTVFYEVWDRPLMTINGAQVISAALRVCGGRNVFAALPVLAPTVDAEAVVAADPELIVATRPTRDGGGSEALEAWRRYPTMRAVRHRQLATVSPDLLARMGPRLADGVAELCETVDRARRERDGH